MAKKKSKKAVKKITTKTKKSALKKAKSVAKAAPKKIKNPVKKTTKTKKVIKPMMKKKKVTAAKKIKKAKPQSKKKTAPKAKKKVVKKATPKKEVVKKKTQVKAKVKIKVKPISKKLMPIKAKAPVKPLKLVKPLPPQKKKITKVKQAPYMTPKDLAHFRQVLLGWREDLMTGVDKTIHHMQDDAANFADPNDRATQEEEFSLELRTRDRERKLMVKIDEALERLENGDYGFCEECGIEIGRQRLEARPTATLCIDCKTLDEIREKQTVG